MNNAVKAAFAKTRGKLVDRLARLAAEAIQPYQAY